MAVVYLVLTRLLVDGLLGAIKNMFLNMSDDPSYQGRTMDYVLVGRMVGDAPWFGHGLGTFDPSVYFILDNQYLGTLIETGVRGPHRHDRAVPGGRCSRPAASAA